MGHPLDDHYDAMRAVRDQVWRRREAIQARVDKISLAEFTGAQFADLHLLYGLPGSDDSSDLKAALGRIEAFLEVRE